jgi:hypothetical protein
MPAHVVPKPFNGLGLRDLETRISETISAADLRLVLNSTHGLGLR